LEATFDRDLTERPHLVAHVRAQAVHHLARHDHLSGLCDPDDARGDVDRVSVDVPLIVGARAEVTADMNPQRQPALRREHRQLHRVRGVHSAIGVRKIAHQPVAHTLDDLAAVVRRGAVQQAEALIDAGVRLLVPKRFIQRRASTDVDEEQGAHAEHLRGGLTVHESGSATPGRCPTPYVISPSRVDCAAPLRG
jgi:hypothetical protein